jgi:conjugative transfer region lipoprotein (TIGR03751 family)
MECKLLQKPITLGWISLVLLGCTSTKESVLPQDGPTMQAIYEQHMTALYPPVGSGNQPLPRAGIAHYSGFVREAASEIESIFPRLPNPTLVMYVFPHLSGEERTPVPGYVTTFPFYEKVEYALPGEVPGNPLGQRTEEGGSAPAPIE